MKKLLKHMKQGRVGLSHGAGGVIAKAIREMARDKYLAKKANAKK